MCNPTVCFLSLSTTSTGVDSLIEQIDGCHRKLFGLRLWCLFYEEKYVSGMLFSRGTNLVCTPAGLNTVSKSWGIEELCIRSTSPMSRPSLISTQQSTQFLLTNLPPLFLWWNLQHQVRLWTTKMLSLSFCVLWFFSCGWSWTIAKAASNGQLGYQFI